MKTEYSLFELSATFGLHILKPWNIFDGSVELLIAAALLVVVVVMFVDTLLFAPPPNIDDSVLALAKLNPIAELGVDDGVVADIADGGVDASAVANGDVEVATCMVGETINLAIVSDDDNDDDDDGGDGACDCTEEFKFPNANEKLPIELVLLAEIGAAGGALFSLLSLVDLSEVGMNELPRSNLNVAEAAVAVIVAGVDVLERAKFVEGCTFVTDAVPNGVAAGVVFIGVDVGAADFVAVGLTAAAGFNVGVLLVAVGVSRSGIFPIVAAAPPPSTLCTDDFDKFNVFSDDFACDVKVNDGVF